MSERDELDCAPCEIEQLEEKVKWQADRIREQRYLLEECEALIVAMRQEIQNLGGSLEGVITADTTLAKLRTSKEQDT